MNDLSYPSNSLGADIRALRKARNTTLEELASRLDRSVGWLSQVERDLSAPTIDDLHKFAETFEVPLSLFFGNPASPAHEQGFVVRSQSRREIGNKAGLTESLLSPDLTDDFEMIHCVFAPGAESSGEIKRDTQEVGTLIEGALTLWIGDNRFDLRQGDSFRVRQERYRWKNFSQKPAVAIWVISPPVY